MINQNHETLSVRRQCQLLSICRSTVYYQAKEELDDTELANEIYEIWIESTASGYRKITAALRRKGHIANRKKVLRIMNEMGIEGEYQKHKTTTSNKEHEKFPYLLKNLAINRPNQVWATDITYIKVNGYFVYLIGVIDWYSKHIIAWHLANSMEAAMCVLTLEKAFQTQARPEIINSDQGVQYTSKEWIGRIKQESENIKISMDGVGRWADNICIERFWKTLKYEYLQKFSFDSMQALRDVLKYSIEHYNTIRLHQTLNYCTPVEIYHAN
jgi:putative transposase